MTPRPWHGNFNPAALQGGLSITIEDPWIHDLMMNLRDHGDIDDEMITDGILEDISFHTDQYATTLCTQTPHSWEQGHQTRISWSEDYYEYED